MYTIFINDAEVYLTDSLDYKEKTTFLKYDAVSLKSIIHRLENNDLSQVYLYHNDLKYLWKNFKKHYKIIKAAGGVVLNDNNEILWIYRNGRWDLPKGKIEKGERKKEAAIREVQEECGLTKLIIDKKLRTTYHTYNYKERKILKITYWYKMYSNQQEQLNPQIEEGITKVEWVSAEKSIKILESTYGNIRLIFKNSLTL